jgi:type I restriction enzyme R subunit
VVVITDRQVLDRQLQDAIYQIEHAQGVVKAIDQDSKQLAAALIDGTKIVITTLQKFPFVLRGLLHAAGAERADEATAEEKAAGQSMGGRNCQAPVCDHRGRSALQPVRRDGAGAEGDSWRNGTAGERRGRTGLGRSVEPGDAIARTAAQSEFLCVHRHAQRQDA